MRQLVLSRSHKFNEDTTLLNKQILKELPADFLQLIVDSLVINQEQSEVFIGCRVLVIYDCEGEVLIHLLCYHIDLLVLLLFPKTQQQLTRLLLICLTSGCKLLHLSQVSALHLLKYAQVPHVLARDSVQQREVVRRVLV